jgi:ABC-type phosphate/phosphonate transport system substrate-binding protein
MLQKFKILIFVFGVLFYSLHAAPIVVFFYNPDAAPTNPALLIKKSAEYFKTTGKQIKIQPVASPKVFANLVKTKKAKAFIASSALAKSLGNTKQILTPISTSGKPTFKKIVLANKTKIKSIPELKGKNIGSTSIGDESLKFLNDFIFVASGYDAKNSKIIWVKKDLDAVLAAKFGQIKAAVISEKNLDKIKKNNPAALKGLETIASSSDIPEGPLCVTADLSAGDIETLKKIFLDMDKNPAGQEFLKLLGYSKWKE